MPTMHQQFKDTATARIKRLSSRAFSEILAERRRDSRTVCRKLAGAWSQSLDDHVGNELAKRLQRERKPTEDN